MTKQEFLERPENLQTKKSLKTVAIVCYICAAITLVAGIAVSGGLGAFLVDVIFLVVMGFLIQKFQSKVCAILLLIVGILNMVIGGGGWLVLIAGIYALIFTFRFDKAWKEYNASQSAAAGYVPQQAAPQPRQAAQQPVFQPQPVNPVMEDDVPKTMPLMQDADMNKTVALDEADATVMMGPAKKIMIKAVDGPLAGEVFTIEDNNVVTVGRNPDCGIVFPQSAPGVSRTHCRFMMKNDQFVIEDLGSSFGTCVANGRRLTANTPMSLPSGTQFYLGKEENRFEVL